MAADVGGRVRRSTIRAVDRRRSRRLPSYSGRAIRPLLLSASVFVVAVLTGALLSGPVGPAGSIRADPARSEESDDPAGPADPAPDGDPAGAGGAGRSGAVPVSATAPGRDPIFAQSMIYTGGVALAVSVAGLVMVSRRRRLW